MTCNEGLHQEDLTSNGSEPVALDLAGVWRGYESAASHTEVLRNLDLTVAERELVVITGPSGSGKSTLLCVMGGLLRAEKGRVDLFGRDLVKLAEPEILEARRRNMGFVFQDIYLMPALTALENVMVVSDLKGAGPRTEEELLDLVGMIDLAHKHPAELSGGERQRVGIARALAGSPRLILADEPTGALDTENALAVMELLRKLSQAEELTVVVVTHDVRLYEYADRVLSLEDGRIREISIIERGLMKWLPEKGC